MIVFIPILISIRMSFLFICFLLLCRPRILEIQCYFGFLDLERAEEGVEGKRLKEKSNRAVVWKPGGAG